MSGLGRDALHEETQQKFSNEQRAKMGRPPHTGRAFGYNIDGTVRENKAVLVRDMFSRFAAGSGHLQGQGWVAVAVSQAGILVPLSLGGALGLALYGPLAPEGVDRGPFTLFVAVAMSITAFPVLARILTDRGIYRSRLGTLAMACAAVDDITAWCLLALVVAVSRGGTPLDSLTAAALVVL